MRLRHSPRGAIIGLSVGLLTMLTLTLLAPGGGQAIAQDQPTAIPPPTSTPSPTPVPVFEIQSTVELAAGGDLNGDGVVNPGDTVIYTIRVRDAGDTPSGPIDVVMQYDPAFISGVAAISDGGLGGQGQIIWSLSDLAAGQEASVNFAATLNGIFPQGRTAVTGTVFVRAGGAELARSGVPPLDVLGPNLRFANAPSYELITDVAQNGQFDPGDTVRFVISYSNTGGGSSEDASIVADYPDELTPQIVSNPDNAQDANGMLTWLIGSVPADGTVHTVQFTVTFAAEFPPGTVTYDLPVAIRSGSGPLDEQIVKVPISGPNLVVTPRYQLLEDANADGLADPGDLVQVTIEYSNVGTETASNVLITAKQDPNQFELSQADQNGVIDTEQGTITWTLLSVDAGTTGEVSYQARVRTLPVGLVTLGVEIAVASDQTQPTSQQLQITTSAPTPESSPSPVPFSSEVRPAQGQGLLTSLSVAILVAAFLCLSLLALVYVASRVLPSTAEEREALDTEEERSANRRLVRELVEGIILTAILFSVMVLGLQNALDRNSINSIIAGIVGYVAGRVASQK